jgi:putative DNA primase/helicase
MTRSLVQENGPTAANNGAEERNVGVGTNNGGSGFREQGRSSPIETIEQQFAAAMTAQGCGDHYIPADGDWHNFQFPDGHNGSAKLTLRDKPDGLVKDWRAGSFWHWDGAGHSFSSKQAAEFARQNAERAERKKADQDESRRLARERFSRAREATSMDDHPYLRAKQIDNPRPAKVDDRGHLLLPLYDCLTGDFQTIQIITADDKLFPRNAVTKRACCLPGKRGLESLKNKKYGNHDFLICEGWANGVKLQASCPTHTVVCAMSKDNLKHVAETLRMRFVKSNTTFAPDNDIDLAKPEKGNPGLEAAIAAARAVFGSKVAQQPPVPGQDYWDVWTNEGADAVKALIDAATVPPPEEEEEPPPTDDDGLTDEQRAEIARLATLSPVQYDLVRKEAARRLGIRVTTLDELVAAKRPAATDDDKQGTAFNFDPVHPATEAVDGEELIEDLQAAIKRHVILSDEQALAVGLWSMHAHALDEAEHSPRLHIASPAKRCGKTTLLNTTADLVPKPVATENISVSAMFRIVEKAQPTLLMDECDILLRDNDDIRAMLNAGHRRSGCVIRTVGDDFEPRSFSVWCAVVIAGIGHIPDTIDDRSITISLRRRIPTEKIERLRTNRTGHLKQLCRRIARWIDDHRVALTNADPLLPEELGDRDHDNWRPLIAIADAISTELGARARLAAKVISLDNTMEEESAAIMCLADVAQIFADTKKDALSSEEVLRALLALDERPWREWRKSRGGDRQPMTKNSMARLLKPFGIKPEQIRPPNGQNFRGYKAEPVREAKLRYVPVDSEEPEQPDTGYSETGKTNRPF